MAGAARTSSARAFDVGTSGGILGNGFLKLDIQKKMFLGLQAFVG